MQLIDADKLISLLRDECEGYELTNKLSEFEVEQYIDSIPTVKENSTKKFKYRSNCTPNSNIPFASDANFCPTETDARKYMKDLESDLATKINEQIEHETLPSHYYILGDCSVIAVAENYDDATLIAETLASHSPYYKSVDVMCDSGLVTHYLSTDCNNDRTNHAFHKHREAF